MIRTRNLIVRAALQVLFIQTTAFALNVCSNLKNILHFTEGFSSAKCGSEGRPADDLLSQHHPSCQVSCQYSLH